MLDLLPAPYQVMESGGRRRKRGKETKGGERKGKDALVMPAVNRLAASLFSGAVRAAMRRATEWISYEQAYVLVDIELGTEYVSSRDIEKCHLNFWLTFPPSIGLTERIKHSL